VRVGIPIADLSAGLFCALGILVALLERETSKKGQHVATSLLQAQIFMLDFQGARWLIGGEVPKQAGNNHPTSIPPRVQEFRRPHQYRLDRLEDLGTVLQCRRRGRAAERPEYQTASRALEAPRRAQCRHGALHGQALERRMDRAAHKAGVPCGPIYNIDQVYADPQVELSRRGAAGGQVEAAHAGQPMSLSARRAGWWRRRPRSRAHRRGAREFGFSAKEIAALREANAV